MLNLVIRALDLICHLDFDIKLINRINLGTVL